MPEQVDPIEPAEIASPELIEPAPVEPAPAPQPMAPVAAGERYEFIDILRGLALFGILAANMRAFNAPLAVYMDISKIFPQPQHVWTQAFIDAFISGKFITLFSFLFGLGFAVQLTRSEARGAKLSSFYPRRLFALMLFGLIHGILLWAGDILLTYSAAGFLLMLFRHRKQKTLVIWSGSILALPVLGMTGYYIATLFGAGASGGGPPPGSRMTAVYRAIEIYNHGSFSEIFFQNLRGWVQFLPFNAMGVMMLYAFLLGLYVWRKGIVQNLADHRGLLRKVCLWTLPLGLVLSATAIIVRVLFPQPPNKMTLVVLFVQGVSFWITPVLSCGYASGLALLFLNERWRARLRPFGAIGRMALTNYLLQTVVCLLLFYKFSGLYGKVGPAVGLIPTVLIYSLQIPFSNWWLARHRYGPMEKLWRRMTYGRAALAKAA